MKKTLLLLATASLAFTACKKSNNPGQDEIQGIFDLPYNKEGIAANKAFIEKEGRALAKKLNDLPSTPAIKAFESLSELGLPEIDITVKTLAKIGHSNEKLAAINGVLKTIASMPTEKESYKLSQAFGIYTYNSKTQGWDKSAATDRLELKFPSIKGGTTNNAILTLNYKSSGKSMTVTEDNWDRIYNPATGEYESNITTVDKTYELPSELTAKMTIGGTAAMNLTSSYSYHNDNLPQSAIVDFNFGAYSAKAEAKNDNNVAGVSFSLAKGAELLIATSGNGNFDALSYDKIVNAGEEDDITDIFLKANADLSIGAVKLAGQVDFKTINEILKPINDKEPEYPNWYDYNDNNEAYNTAVKKYSVDYEKWEKEYYTAFANALNKHAALVVANTNSNQKIAAITFELDQHSYNSGSQIYYDVKPLLLFGDGSKIDFDDFGETGFQNFVDDIENLINKFER